MDDNEFFKEIDLIQSCIRRMASNSFVVKGWALTVLAGATAITQGRNLNEISLFVCTVFVPFVCFWVLDAFFLQTERRYRRMYADRLEKRKQGNTDHFYELDPGSYKADGLFRIMWSKTLGIFYGIPLAASLTMFLLSVVGVTG